MNLCCLQYHENENSFILVEIKIDVHLFMFIIILNYDIFSLKYSVINIYIS